MLQLSGSLLPSWLVMSGRSPLLLSTNPASAHNYTFLLWPDGSSGEGFFGRSDLKCISWTISNVSFEQAVSLFFLTQQNNVPLFKNSNPSSFTSALKCRKQKCSLVLLELIHLFITFLSPRRTWTTCTAAEVCRGFGGNLSFEFLNNKAHSSPKLLFATCSVSFNNQ